MKLDSLSSETLNANFPSLHPKRVCCRSVLFQGGHVGLDDGSHQLLGGQWACFAFLDLSDDGHQRRSSECDYHQKGEGGLFFRAWIRV